MNKQDYYARKRKEALNALKMLETNIKMGVFDPISFGTWTSGLNNVQHFKFEVKVNDSVSVYQEIPPKRSKK